MQSRNLVFQYLIRASYADQLSGPAKAEALDQRDRELEDYLGELARTSSWNAVTFQNGWSNFGGVLNVVEYRKVGDMVDLRGTMKGGTVGPVPAFVLPVGFRPPARIQMMQVGPAGGTATVDVYNNGNVQVEYSAAGNGAVSFSGSFSVTP